MTKQRAQKITGERNRYIRSILRDIQEKYPGAGFDISRGPGLKQATILVSAPTKNHFDLFDAIGDGWGDAIEKGYTFYIMPAWKESFLKKLLGERK